MRVVYYYNNDLKIAPVKKFLLEHGLKPDNTTKQQNRRIKTLAFVDQAIKFIAENKGQPIPPILYYQDFIKNTQNYEEYK